MISFYLNTARKIFILSGLMLIKISAALNLTDAWISRLRQADSDTHNMLTLEVEAIHNSRERAGRQNDVLNLFLKNGEVIKLKNIGNCNFGTSSGGCKQFLFAGYFPNSNCFYVFVAYGEGRNWLIIDSNDGTKTLIDGFPELSPEGKYLLVLQNDNLTGPSGIELRRRSKSGFIKTYEGMPVLKKIKESYSYVYLEKWISANEVALKTETFVGDSPAPIVEHVHLKESNSTWEIRWSN